MRGDRTRRPARARGQTVIIVALLAVMLFVLAAMTFDLGLTMADRRTLQDAADNAAVAGAMSYAQGASAAHWVTMQYLQRPLGFRLPVAGCTGSSACPAGTYTVGPYTITIQDASATQMDLSVQHRVTGLLSSLFGVGPVTTASSVRTTAPGPLLVASSYAVATLRGDFRINGGGNRNQMVTGPVYAQASFGQNNHALPVPATQTDYTGNACGLANHVDLGGSSNGLSYTWTGGSGVQNTSVSITPPYDGDAPTVGPAVWNPGNIASAKDTSGNWKPGTYTGGIAPNGGTLNPGVYRITGYAGTIAPGANAVATAAGSADPAGAVALVLDGTDTGSLDLSNANLNGLDDLKAVGAGPPRDPQGTHNFAIWSSSGPGGFTGAVTLSSTTVTGIVYLPGSAFTSSGNASFDLIGATWMGSLLINGGGNGSQQFDWICGLDAVLSGSAIHSGVNR